MEEVASGGDECTDNAGGVGNVLASLHRLRRHTDGVAGRRREDVRDSIAREGCEYSSSHSLYTLVYRPHR